MPSLCQIWRKKYPTETRRATDRVTRRSDQSVQDFRSGVERTRKLVDKYVVLGVCQSRLAERGECHQNRGAEHAVIRAVRIRNPRCGTHCFVNTRVDVPYFYESPKHREHFDVQWFQTFVHV